MIPVKGGVRKRRVRMPMTQSAGDNTIIRYSTPSITYSTIGTLGVSVGSRVYIPGSTSAGQLANPSGPSIVSYYGTGKFLPGTVVSWEPSVSFTTSGRVFVGFTDNPEVIALINVAYASFVATPTAASYATYANLVKGLGSIRSFPVWQETSWAVPTNLRRKRFDTNASATLTSSDELDRSCQTAMFVAIEAGPGTSTVLGGFNYHDVVNVEGVQAVGT
nr:structural protein [Tolivirales sp.]